MRSRERAAPCTPLPVTGSLCATSARFFKPTTKSGRPRPVACCRTVGSFIARLSLHRTIGALAKCWAQLLISHQMQNLAVTLAFVLLRQIQPRIRSQVPFGEALVNLVESTIEPKGSNKAHRYRLSRQRLHPEDQRRQGVGRPAAQHRQRGRGKHGEHWAHHGVRDHHHASDLRNNSYPLAPFYVRLRRGAASRLPRAIARQSVPSFEYTSVDILIFFVYRVWPYRLCDGRCL